jgi:antitoxin component YwqK of YwqJK toxin-antitoxin module
MTENLDIEIHLKKHFESAKIILTDEKIYEFYTGSLNSQITLFNLIEQLEKNINYLQNFLNNKEFEKYPSSLPSNTFYQTKLINGIIEIEKEWLDDYESIFIKTDIYLSLLINLYESLLNDKFYNNGQPKFSISFNKEKRDGIWEGWYENGQYKFRGEYSEGLKIQKWITYYPNGQINTIKNYNMNGELNGDESSWYNNGEKLSERNHLNGKQNGVSKLWYSNGQLMNSYNFVNGKVKDGKYQHFYSNGNLNMEITYENGIDIEIKEYKNVC